MSHTPNEPQPNGYPQQGNYQQPPKKKRKKWPWVVGILILIVILLFAGCAALLGAGGKAVDKAIQSESSAAAATHTLELKATSTAGGTAIYGASGSTNSDQFTSSWSKSVSDVKRGDGYALTVTGTGTSNNAEVTCKIFVDGKEKVSEKGSGSLGSATCVLPLDL